MISARRPDAAEEARVAKFKDYYEVLGVPPRSHARVIEETYWERAHELHSVPTRSAQKRLSALNEAYEVLGSPHKREDYDRRHRYEHQQDGAGSAGRFWQSVLSLLTKPFRPD
jgi:curved DNA-binding protein CbpA